MWENNTEQKQIEYKETEEIFIDIPRLRWESGWNSGSCYWHVLGPKDRLRLWKRAGGCKHSAEDTVKVWKHIYKKFTGTK